MNIVAYVNLTSKVTKGLVSHELVDGVAFNLDNTVISVF